MPVKSIIEYFGATVEAGLILDNTNIKFEALDPLGNKPTVYIPFSDNSNFTNRTIGWYKEKINDDNCSACQLKANNGSIKFGSSCALFLNVNSYVRLPLESSFQNCEKFTIDFIIKFNSVAPGTNYLISDLFMTGGSTPYVGYTRWAISRDEKNIQFMVCSLTGDISYIKSTSDILNTTDVFRIRVSYDGSLIDGSCTASISIAVDGDPLSQEATSNTFHKVGVPPLYSGIQGVVFGSLFRDDSVFGFYPVGYGDNFFLNEVIMYKDQILSPTATPSTSVLLPFPVSQPKTTVIVDGGALGAFWDISSLSFINETEFTAGNLLLRVAAHDTAPSFIGSPDTLTNIKAGADLTGRYLGVEVTWPVGDGLTQYTLTPGSIMVTSVGPVILPTKPTLSGYSRTNSTGVATVTGADPTSVITAYAINLMSDPPTMVNVGSRVGNGDIALDLSAFHWVFFDVTIQMPLALFLIAGDAGNSSEPSNCAMPVLWDRSVVADISGVHRVGDGSSVEMTVSGIEVGGSLLAFYTDGEDVIKTVNLVNGVNTLNGISMVRPCTFVFVNFTGDVQFGGVVAGTEPWKGNYYSTCKILVT